MTKNKNRIVENEVGFDEIEMRYFNPVDEDTEESGYIENLDGTPVILPNQAPVNSLAPQDAGTTVVEDIVHDKQGNVRPAFAPEGIGQVTEADAMNVIARAEAGGRLRVVERADDAGVYDVFDAAGRPLVFGASEEVVQDMLDQAERYNR